MTVKVAAGQLDKRVTIQSETLTPDGQGGNTSVWTDGATTWAGIAVVKSWEKYFAGQLLTSLTHVITMRYRTDVTAKSRIKYGTRFFNVRGVVDVDEEHVVLKLGCEESLEVTA